MKRTRLSPSASSPNGWRECLVSAAAIALLITFSGCHAKKESAAAETPPVPPSSTHHVSAAEAQKLLAEKKALVLDVRTRAHIPGARNVDFRAPDFEQKIAALDKATPYLVHCASGNRSQQALPLFQKHGFQFVYHLDGGIQAWKKADLPIEQ